MKYLKQFFMIIFISFLGEILHAAIPLPVPASIYGIVLLFAGLMSGVIPLDAVKEAGRFLIEIMPVMFIPAGVGLMVSWGVLKPLLLPVSIITVVSFLTVVGATGRTSQWLIRRERRKQDDE